MALNYNILQNKNKVKFNSDFDGTSEVYGYDLLSYSFNKDIQQTGAPIEVTKEYIGRPDLISFAKYGTDKYGDIICKINGISNPFELNEGDLIYLPNATILETYINTRLINVEIPDEFVEDDTETIEKRYSTYQKLKNQQRMPSEQIIGDTNYILDKNSNIIYY